MKPFKRLLRQKITLADINQITNNVFTNLGKDGREILKAIENYKYKVSQFSQIVADEKGKKKIEDCIQDLDNVSAFIYSFVYDLENYELVEDYDKQIEFDVPEDIDEDVEIEQEEDVEEDMENEDTEGIDEDMPDFGDENPFDEAAENDEDFEEPEE